MHDLASLILHFHFFFRVAALEENIDVRQHVERDGVRINFRQGLSVLSATGRTRRGEGGRFDLFFQFIDCARTAARDGLITCCEDAANPKCAMQRVNCHQRNCGRAIRIGNETAMFLYILPVDLWNNQWNVRIHSENRRVIDHNRAPFAGSRDEFSGSLSARAEKCDVNVVE